MYIFEMMRSKLDLAIQELTKLVDHYNHLEDAALMDKTSLAYDNIRSYIRIQENVLNPYLREHGAGPELEKLMRRAYEMKESIHYLMEHQIMVHVDEPHGFFLDRQRQLLEMLREYRAITAEGIHSQAFRMVSESDQPVLQARIEEQMQEESIPSKGLEIY